MFAILARALSTFRIEPQIYQCLGCRSLITANGQCSTCGENSRDLAWEEAKADAISYIPETAEGRHEELTWSPWVQRAHDNTLPTHSPGYICSAYLPGRER